MNMKELSIEEKAIAYDEVIERANSLLSGNELGNAWIYKLLPELRESEDERIRKTLIKYFRNCVSLEGINGEDISNWLEKQGSQKSEEEVNNLHNHLYGEQKSADKLEPKFKVGDWVVYCNEDVDLITGIEENGYRINNGGYIPFMCASDIRLWTIQQDAKAGDVLVSESTCGLGTWYCIFKSLDSDESMTVYCYLARDGRFETKKELCFDKDPYNTKPATKEQRNLLFQKMHEAGYEWDAEKKELKKIEKEIEIPFGAKDSELQEVTYFIPDGFHAEIDDDKVVIKKGEQKPDTDFSDLGTWKYIVDAVWTEKEGIGQYLDSPFIEEVAKKLQKRFGNIEQKPAAWSEEDEMITLSIEQVMNCASLLNIAPEKIDKIRTWLKSIKDKVQPQQKQEWSEEDEARLNSIYGLLEGFPLNQSCLKSLKERYTWKPSDEQMDALHYVTNFDYGGHKATLVSLYEQLKKLREK